MKALLFILVIGNLLLLGLAFTPDPDAPGKLVTPPLPPGVQPLQLLSERLEPAQVPPAEEDQATEVSPQETTPQAEETTEPEQSAEETTLAEAETAAPEPAPVEEPPPPPPEPVCHTIGPFAEQAQANSFAEQLNELGVLTEMRQSEIQEPSGYWVYLPSMPRAKAEETVADLIDNDIQDYFLGPQNYISLGIYSQQGTAQERFEQITDLGYNPKLEQRFKVRDVYWLDAEEPEPLLDEAQWQELLAEFQGVRRQNLACE